MIFNPYDKRKCIRTNFPQFSLHGSYLTSVTSFKYLGHIIDDALHDDNDINRELKCLFTRVNLLNRRFWRCSIGVKLQLFKTFCMCFYDIGLWSSFRVGTLNKLAAAYVRCIKIFFGYHKYASVTCMLLDLGLPSFKTILFNAGVIFNSRLSATINSLVHYAARV